MVVSSDDITASRRTFLRRAGAGAVAVSLAGCTGEDAPADTETTASATATATPTTNNDGDDPFPVTVTQGQMATTLDPHDHRETSTRSVLLQAYERVVFRDRDGQVVERIATDWERVDDGEVRFEIREGVTFHDGQPLTAEDCAYSIRRVVDDETHIASPQAGQLAGITGAEARSETDLRVFSDGFNPILVASLATYCPVVSKAWTENREPTAVAQATNGTGPYRMVEYESGSHVELEAFEGYWGDVPDPSSATITAVSESSTRVNSLRAGETDVITNVPPQDVGTIQEEAGAAITAVPSTRNLFLVLNDAYEPFASKPFRQALNYAIDLEAIIENVLNGFGEPTGQPTLEGSVGYAADVDPYPYDPERAADLVEQSGHAGTSFELHTPVGRYLRDFEVAQAVAGYIDDLPNVSTEVVQREFSSMVSEFTDGDPETSPPVFLIGSSNPSRDASQKFNSWLLPSSPISHVRDEAYTELYDAAQSERDPDLRAERLADINRRAHEEASLVFLHRQYSVYGVSSRISWEPRQDELILLEDVRAA